ncbi:hypothetical protein [uncultured Jannaschia sp.]|uniref:hypothetical protein n=1 Tax=uncultured Jannaschia sp. TaxID=293347 RepID=UPI002624070C|nr:hypothetical protein [uncultured Jannaschia sp.]
MRRLSRPWSARSIPEDRPFEPNDCLVGTYDKSADATAKHVLLMEGSVRGEKRSLALFPYPKRESDVQPDRVGFPVRPRKGQEPKDDAEIRGADALRRMNEVLARIQELEGALDDPADVWPRLRAAWKRAENEADPRMAEIVRQAREIRPVLKELQARIRRVLRRHRELTPLDRVREMDRASMVWLSRQPGRTVAERAGAGQRILATVRKENFDTLENRVLHAYARLAADVAREWMREHPHATQSARYALVEAFRKTCRALADTLAEMGISVAEPGVTPNYVLSQDPGYRRVHDCWVLLLQRERIIDDLWAWQAQTWTDFAVLAVTLAVDELDEAQLVAQSPIDWRAEAVTGRWFNQDRPIAVFWLRQTGRIVEIQARPEGPGALLTAARAHVAMRITDPARNEVPQRVPIWTPHAMNRIDLTNGVAEAAALLDQLQVLATLESLRNGLILTPAHDTPETLSANGQRGRVTGIALGASGPALAEGLEAVRAFVRSEFYGALA